MHIFAFLLVYIYTWPDNKQANVVNNEQKKTGDNFAVPRTNERHKTQLTRAEDGGGE
jgi:hypothetical protein